MKIELNDNFKFGDKIEVKMINKIVLKSLIDPEDPNKALEYLEKNMTEKEYVDWITQKIIEQKDNEMIRIPILTMFNIFMDYIQDTCGQPYDLFEDVLRDQNSINIYDEEFSNILVDEKWNCRYYLSLIQHLLKKYNGSAKKFIMSGNFYCTKNNKIEANVILSDDFTTIEEFDFVKED